MKLILSISGGGIRGLIPAIILAELEKRIGKPIADCFDLISGTSTGGIIACLLATPNNNGTTKYTSSKIVELYKQFGKTAFYRNSFRKVLSLGGLLSTKYSTKPLAKLLHEYFGELKLSQTKTNLLIPTYQISNTPAPHFFKTQYATQPDSSIDNPYLWECARATSAANGYFKPYKMNDSYTFLDGGVFANNPSMCAYSEMKNAYGNEPVCVVSIGTGEDLVGYKYDKIKFWGMAQWALPFFKHTSISADSTVDYMLRTFAVNSDKYYRLQASLDEDSLQMDNISDANLAMLELAAKKVIIDYSDLIDEIVRLVVENYSENEK